MVASWVLDEMETVELRDKRLNARLRLVLSQLAERPTASIPSACGGNAEMAAAYRLFDNEKTTFDGILKPHAEATKKRIASQSVVILAQDTTEVDLTRPASAVVGAGPLDHSRVGVFLHLLHAFTPDGTPLGTVHALPWARDENAPRTASLSRAQRGATPIEEKESQRWVTVLREAQTMGAACPQTRCVCVADSESDIYEVLAQGSQATDIEWIVRACQNRALACENPGEKGVAMLRERVLETPVLFTHTTNIRARQPKIGCETRGRRRARTSRAIETTVRASRVTLRPPRRPDRELPEVTLNAVLVLEEHPPADEEAVAWLLLTSLPIDDAEQVRQVIQYYTTRWMIEILFRVLKSGCRVEERRFETLDRLLPCVAVYLIVAWRTLYVCRLGRSCPDIDCEAMFEPAEWKSVWKVVRREDPPRKPPSLKVMVRLVAQLGGYVNRPRAAPPGPQTLWIGLQRTHDFAICWQLFGPEARQLAKDV
jgi:hypothetical protein